MEAWLPAITPDDVLARVAKVAPGHVFLILLQSISVTIQFSFTVYILTKYRDARPIIARSPVFLAISNFGAVVYFITSQVIFSDVLEYEDGPGGRALQFFSDFGEATYFVGMLMRLYRLKLQLNVNQEKIALHNDKTFATEEGMDSSFDLQSRWKKQLELRWLLTVFGIIIVPLVIGHIIFVAVVDHKGGEADIVVFLLEGAFYGIGFGYFIISLRQAQDSFNHSQEIYSVAQFCLISRLAFALDTFAGIGATLIPSILQVISSFLVMYYSGMHPLKLIRDEERFRHRSVNLPLILDPSAFEEQLRDPLYVKYFQRFAMKEFTLEDLLFYLDVQQFKGTHVGPAERQQMAKEIQLKYINDKSPLQISITDQMREQISWDIEHGNVHPGMLFTLPENAIWLRMKEDSFVRFLMSKDYQDLKDEVAGRAATIQMYSQAQRSPRR